MHRIGCIILAIAAINLAFAVLIGWHLRRMQRRNKRTGSRLIVGLYRNGGLM